MNNKLIENQHGSKEIIVKIKLLAEESGAFCFKVLPWITKCTEIDRNCYVAEPIPVVLFAIATLEAIIRIVVIPPGNSVTPVCHGPGHFTLVCLQRI